MLMLKALKNRSITLLWLGQVGSSIGDEIYRVAFIWLAVDLVGSDTGYLASLQIFAVLLFTIVGGKWADRWSPYRTMIGVDLIRAVITLTPVVLFYTNHQSFSALVISSIFLAGLGAFFEPAMQATLPLISRDTQTLKAANGLMSTTLRLARVMGPALIGILSAFFATVHFFTINAATYLLSAWSVFGIRKSIPAQEHVPEAEQGNFLKIFLAAFDALRKKPAVFQTLIAKSVTGGAWGLVYGLGMALLVHEIAPKDVKAFGLIMGSYGIGNIISAVLIGNMERKHPERMVYIGLAWLGVCFLGVGIAQSFPLLMLATALTAIGGPLNDIPFVDLVQAQFPLRDLPKIFRLRMTMENLSTFVFMFLSPLLFRAFPIRSVIVGCGFFILFFGIAGLIRTRSAKSVS
jgi:DHA3 family macrolide efflux protein-like MFS transporter